MYAHNLMGNSDGKTDNKAETNEIKMILSKNK